jgi:hypothetical protein
MIRGHDRAMRRHQPLRIPCGLKDGFVHSAATRGRSVFPPGKAWMPCRVLFGLRIKPVTSRLTWATPAARQTSGR